ncbi:replication initiator protein A [Enterococcus mundtii]|nr:replication initiator protein A [Enterococcus mundtii]UBM07026.1 replication initiator protein A [Enterococcus mundtii]UBM07063.1 replication initiator protein A [Enterococcus mundtii]
MTNFNFITAQETYRALYYQLPKVLFTSPYYKDMSNDSKIAYAMLQDRCEASIQNNWVDEQNRVYFIFTRNELMDILGCKENKISKIKKELKDKNLLFEQKTPPKKLPNGTWHNLPNRLYLGKLEVSAEDVFMKKNIKEDISESGKNPLSDKIPSNSDSCGGGKNPLSKETALNQHSFESGKKGGNLFYSYNPLDTNRHNIDTEKDQLQDQLLLDNFETIMKDNSIATFIPERVLSLIKTFSSSYSEAQKTVQTIHNAKAKAEKDTQTKIIFEDLDIYGLNAEQELYQTLLKAYQKQKTEKVENIQNLIFVYVKNWFMENPIAAKQQAESSEKLPKVPLHDWLNEG